MIKTSHLMPLPADTREFIQRWRDKRDCYNVEKLEDCFDRFFTSYVLYDYLCQLITTQEEYGFDRVGERAVMAARKFLGAKTLYGDEALRRETATIIELIEKGRFYIRDESWDEKRVSKLRTNDPEQWSEGLLEIVYKIRCNTFHGKKRFEPSQRRILEPCIRVLEQINDKLIEKLDA